MWNFHAGFTCPYKHHNSSAASPPGAVALLVDELATLAVGSGNQNSFDGRTPLSLARRGVARRGSWGRGESAASASAAAMDRERDASPCMSRHKASALAPVESHAATRMALAVSTLLLCMPALALLLCWLPPNPLWWLLLWAGA